MNFYECCDLTKKVYLIVGYVVRWFDFEYMLHMLQAQDSY